jgi:flagellar biosynthesis/type III secretory pathway protein FliH
MKNLNDECKRGKDAGAKFLIVNRKYFEYITQEIAKLKKVDPWLVIVDKYKGLIVAVTDVTNFEFQAI